MAPEERRGWLRVAAPWRFVLPAVAVTAAIVGYLGMGPLLRRRNEFEDGVWDRLYYTMQLFVLGSPPLDSGGTLPVSLQIARFLAPAVTIYAVVEAVRLLFATELARLRARRSRGHVIVCGESLVADAITMRLAAEGRKVVRVLRSGDRAGGRRRLLFVPGDSAQAGMLSGAGIRHADTLYACSGDTARDLSVVLAAGRLRRRSVLRVHVQVDDPELCLALEARRLSRREEDKLIVNFFNWQELAARALLNERRPPVYGDRPTRVMVVGASLFARALIVELARIWRLHAERQPLMVILVDASAYVAVDRLCRLYPFVDEMCRFITRNLKVDTLLDGDIPDAPADRVYICCDDEEVGLKLALTMDHLWRGGPRSVIVRLGQLGGLTRAFHGPGEWLLDPVSGTLDMFDALRAGTDVTLTEDSLTERLARAIHDRYLRRQVGAGIALGSAPAVREWSELGEELRDDNRTQAADIGPKLQAVGCALAPNPVWGEPSNLTPAMIDLLAQREHRRWCQLKRETGWRYATHRDDANREHPDLLDWEDLPEAAKEKDRDAVRQMPELLSDAGFRIVRVRSTPCQRPAADRQPTTTR